MPKAIMHVHKRIVKPIFAALADSGSLVTPTTPLNLTIFPTGGEYFISVLYQSPKANRRKSKQMNVTASSWLWLKYSENRTSFRLQSALLDVMMAFTLETCNQDVRQTHKNYYWVAQNTSLQIFHPYCHMKVIDPAYFLRLINVRTQNSSLDSTCWAGSATLFGASLRLVYAANLQVFSRRRRSPFPQLLSAISCS